MGIHHFYRGSFLSKIIAYVIDFFSTPIILVEIDSLLSGYGINKTKVVQSFGFVQSSTQYLLPIMYLSEDELTLLCKYAQNCESLCVYL